MSRFSLVEISLGQHTPDAASRNLLDTRSQPHLHASHELVCLMNSGYDVQVDGRTIRGSPGDVFCFPQDTPHLPTPRSLDLRVLSLRWTDGLRGFDPGRAVRVRDGRGRIQLLLSWLWENRLRRAGRPTKTDLALLQLVLAEHRRLSLGETLTFSDKVTDYLERHLHESVSLQEVAKALQVSVSYLIRQFRRQVGETPGKRLQRLRTERARALLATSLDPVRGVATRVGLSSVAHLNLLLKRYYGATARQLRS